jgi:hypothetical protein
MTERMLQALNAGRFLDPVWVHGLLARFADYYFDALDAYERRAPSTPVVWSWAHDIACQQISVPVENMLLGINAHINYDLPLALRDVLQAEWPHLTEAERERRLEDHTRVNLVIRDTCTAVQREVIDRYDHLIRVLDVHCAPLVRVVDWEVARALATWRAEVWEHAVQLLEAATAPASALAVITHAAVLRSRVILCELDLRGKLIAAPLRTLDVLDLPPHHVGLGAHSPNSLPGGLRPA